MEPQSQARPPCRTLPGSEHGLPTGGQLGSLGRALPRPNFTLGSDSQQALKPAAVPSTQVGGSDADSLGRACPAAVSGSGQGGGTQRGASRRQSDSGEEGAAGRVGARPQLCGGGGPTAGRHVGRLRGKVGFGTRERLVSGARVGSSSEEEVSPRAQHQRRAACSPGGPRTPC